MTARMVTYRVKDGRTEENTQYVREVMASEREAEILAFITQGLSNADVSARTYLSPNTVKSYIRTLYRKIGVSSRTQAVLWGIDHGFAPDHHRIDHWRGGP
jgi:DNA-binding NarL/FixJ family response regulator